MGTNAITFNVDLAYAYGCGMSDGKHTVRGLTKDNAPNFLAMPDDVPTPENVQSTLDAYRLGFWQESKRVAEKFLRTV